MNAMPETEKNEPDCSAKLLAELTEFIEDSSMELRFRGCGDNHRLLRWATELRHKLLKAQAGSK